MKKISLTILFIVTSCLAFAQPSYIPNPALDKFVGTWVTTTGSKEITITFKKIQFQTPIRDWELDYLEGYLVHKDSGNIIEASDRPMLTQGTTIAENGDQQDNIIYLNYHDLKKSKGGRMTVVLADNQKEFKAYLMDHERLIILGPNVKPRERGFYIALSYRV